MSCHRHLSLIVAKFDYSYTEFWRQITKEQNLRENIHGTYLGLRERYQNVRCFVCGSGRSRFEGEQRFLVWVASLRIIPPSLVSISVRDPGNNNSSPASFRSRSPRGRQSTTKIVLIDRRNMESTWVLFGWRWRWNPLEMKHATCREQQD